MKWVDRGGEDVNGWEKQSNHGQKNYGRWLYNRWDMAIMDPFLYLCPFGKTFRRRCP